jgi:hypothetical protein
MLLSMKACAGVKAVESSTPSTINIDLPALKIRLGLLINFNVPVLKSGIKRFVQG